MADPSRTSTGARLELRVGNIIVAYANNVTYSKTHDVESIKGIDDLVVKEHAELGSTVTFSASMFRIAHESVTRLGIMPRLNDLLKQPELSVLIRDNTNNTVMLQVFGVKCTGISGNVDARGVWVESLNFVGRELVDEEG